jgi:glycosyltransferase involved in cell wall biosynthesis
MWLRRVERGVQVHRLHHYVPGRQSAWRRGLYEATFLLHALSLRRLSRPDAVLGIVPSLSGGALAALAARLFGVPFGLLFQDLVAPAASQSGVPGGGRVARATGAVERQVALGADRIAVIAEGFRPYLVGLGVDASRIHRVRNWTHIGQPRRDRETTRAALGLPHDATICLHAGNMGYKQGLENVVECARRAVRTDPSLLFVLMGDGNQRTHLESLASGLPNIRFLPPQPEEEFPDVLAAADMLLINQRPTILDMSLPGKLTSYLFIGRPVVAAVAPASETALELKAAGCGVVVDPTSAEALLAALRRLAADPVSAGELGERGQNYARNHFTAAAALGDMERFVAGLARVPVPERIDARAAATHGLSPASRQALAFRDMIATAPRTQEPVQMAGD